MKKLLYFGILMIYANLSLAEVSAWVDNNPVVVGEMFRLHIEAKNADDPEEPDLSEIRGLQVLNRSVQNQTSIVGTSITRTVNWTYVMLAPSSGNYLIPALQVGSEQTSPIALKAVNPVKILTIKLYVWKWRFLPKKYIRNSRFSSV